MSGSRLTERTMPAEQNAVDRAIIGQLCDPSIAPARKGSKSPRSRLLWNRILGHAEFLALLVPIVTI
jgi:hypothetical protein